MLASQLIIILETMPSDMKHETCAFDVEEQNMNMNMKENYDSKSFGKAADTLAFEGKEICQVNGSKRTNYPIGFEVNSGDKHWNLKIIDDLSKNCESGRLDSSRKSSAAKDEEKLQSSPALELFNIDKNSESKDFGSPQMTTSDLFTDKNVLECESSELIVRDKEINCHAVKDICIDEGMPTKDKILIKSCKDDLPGAEGGVDNVFVISNGLEAASSGNTKSVGETECGKIGVSYDELLAQCRSKSPSENLSADGSAKNCEMEDSMQISETNCVSSNVSKGESYVDSELPIQEFGTRSFLRSFLKSLDDEGNKSVEQHDEIFSGKEGSKIPESAVEAEPKAEAKEDIKPNILYESKAEGGSITFNFNSPAQMVSNITNEQTTENLKEPSIESGNVHAHTDGNADNISDSSLAQCTSTKDNATGDAQERAVDVKNEDSDRSSKAILVQDVSSKDVKNEMTYDGQAIEQHSIKHGRKNSDEVSVVQQLRQDEGESSFTAAGLITFSGPIAYSGSLSLRSDGSTASGRSFAFPILQSEWNSSPVRMAKADRRNFRKHKGWRSGLLCCRF